MKGQRDGQEPRMSGSVGWRAAARLAVFSLLLPVVLFGAAGRFDWAMGWLYAGMVLSVTVATRLVVQRVNPDLIAERASSVYRADVPAWDRILLPFLIGVCPVLVWLIAGLSQRFGWLPHVTVPLQLAGTLVMLVGGLISSWAMVVNPFFSAVVRIQRDRGHSVVSTGPYRFARHPGYAGAALVNVGAPLMLDAYWAFVPAGIVIVALVIRTAFEDRTLRAELSGYETYARHTRYRLLPGIW